MTRDLVRALLPVWLRDRRASLRDVQGFYTMRRQWADNTVAADLLACVRMACLPIRTVLFFPERPPKESVDYKLCALLGCAITTNPSRRFDVAFKRRDTTFFDPALLQTIPIAADRIVNVGSTDISKKRLSRSFAEVFGYAIEVDPITYAGSIVEKSDRNAAHDGRVIRGPIAAGEVKPDAVYQKALDNRSGADGMVLDHRAVIHGDRIVLVYLKQRSVETRFSNTNASVGLAEPDAVFSPAERTQLLALAGTLGIDYGEFDVLRDNADGRIYVVDANNTPWGPPNGLSSPDAKRALRTMTASFGDLLGRWKTGAR